MLHKKTLTELPSCEHLFNLLKTGDAVEIIKAFCQYHPKDIASLRDECQNTVLHIATAYNSVALLKTILKMLEPFAPDLCRVVNDKGEMPLTFAEGEKNPETRTDLLNALLPFTLDVKIKKLTEKLSATEVLNEYPDPALGENLTLACLAVNYARRDIKISTSHPDINHLDFEQKLQWHSQFQTARYSLAINLRKADLSDPVKLEKIAQILQTYGAANCAEYSLLVCYYLSKLCKNKSFQLIQIKHGDHVFAVLDDEKPDTLNPVVFGKRAVVIDAWACRVYPASTIPQHLTTYMTKGYGFDVKQTFSVIGSFNPNYHKLIRFAGFTFGKPLKPIPVTCSLNYLIEVISQLKTADMIRFYLDYHLEKNHLADILGNTHDILKLLDSLPLADRWKAGIVMQQCSFNFNYHEGSREGIIHVLLSMKNTFQLSKSSLDQLTSLSDELTDTLLKMANALSQQEGTKLVNAALNRENALGCILHQGKKSFLATRKTQSDKNITRLEKWMMGQEIMDIFVSAFHL